MQYGVIFPTRDIALAGGAIREYALTVEELGYAHVLMYDHVVGIDRAANPDWLGQVELTDHYHEPLVTLGFLAAACTLELVTGVVVLPQRQTVLVAKQIAELDIVSDGRVRFGVGMGWNELEYTAMGVPFGRRARRFEEQIGVLRRLWQEESVSVETDLHTLHGVGVAPKPSRRIPIWIGARSEPGYRRAGALGDGLFWLGEPDDTTERQLAIVWKAREASGRPASEFGLDVHVNVEAGLEDVALRQIDWWQLHGATHVTLRTDRQRNVPIGMQLQRLESISGALAFRNCSGD